MASFWKRNKFLQDLFHISVLSSKKGHFRYLCRGPERQWPGEQSYPLDNRRWSCSRANSRSDSRDIRQSHRFYHSHWSISSRKRSPTPYHQNGINIDTIETSQRLNKFNRLLQIKEGNITWSAASTLVNRALLADSASSPQACCASPQAIVAPQAAGNSQAGSQ